MRWLFLCLCPLYLFAFEEMTLETGAAEYKGKVLYLHEGVTIHHPLGHLSSEEMILKPMAGVSPIRLGSADLTKRVRLELTEGGILDCSEASIDFSVGKGTFLNGKEQDFVIFSQSIKDKLERLPFIVKARQMELDFDAKAPQPVIQKIAIHRDVQIDYNHDFIAAGDEGIFIRSASTQPGLNGKILLQADPEKLCSVTNRNGDLIRSAQIAIDTEGRTIDFEKSSGSLMSDRSKLSQKVDFAADKARWSDRENAVLLQRNVSLHQKGMGTLKTDGELKITQCPQNNKRKLATIESYGKTVLEQGGDETGPKRTLTCHGKLLVDHADSVITMDSPPEGGQQVFLEDARGHVYADKATIHYSLDKAVLQVVLEGDVQVQNVQSEKPQYALADILEYCPATQEMTLKAKAGNRVLLYDQAKDLQISAPGILLKRDPITQKETVKGLGDVRFSLVKEEFSELRKKFSLKNQEEG